MTKKALHLIPNWLYFLVHFKPSIPIANLFGLEMFTEDCNMFETLKDMLIVMLLSQNHPCYLISTNYITILKITAFRHRNSTSIWSILYYLLTFSYLMNLTLFVARVVQYTFYHKSALIPSKWPPIFYLSYFNM